ncbi:MAG: hypothetical protein GXX99_05205 [Clostridiales bacterium]|nr:hypothetical protein [Clostridiales bacterium]
MKRRFSMIPAALLLALALCACQKETLPVPDYPLDLATVEQALAEWGVDCTVKADPVTTANGMALSAFRVFSAEDETHLCTVNSGLRNGERVLTISFPAFSAPNALTPEQSQGALAFAARLFGGFAHADQVHEHFVKEYNNTHTGRVKSNVYRSDNRFTLGTTARWGRLIDGIACQIILVQPSVEDPQESIKELLLSSDWDTFYPERRL